MALTNLHFVEFLKQAKEKGIRYWYGTYGNNCTQSKYDSKKKQYPSHYGSSRTSQYKKDIANKQVCVDCIGLLKAYMWSNGGESVLAAVGTDNGTGVKYASNGYPDVSANGAFDYAKKKKMDNGSISSIPDIPGIAVRYNGHVGYYIGNGKVIEARGFNYGVVETKLAGRKWTHWYKIPGITYTTTSENEPTPAQLGNRILKKGMTGADVEKLQSILVYDFHYNLGNYGVNKDGVDGEYGKKCEEAIKDFQSRHSLSVDGQYGPKTHKALMTAIADIAPDPTPEPELTPEGKYLEVTASTLNLRAGDGTAYPILTVTKKGDKLVPVLDKNGNLLVSANGWCAVYRDADIAWCSNKYVKES